jgi:hypothetical protein
VRERPLVLRTAQAPPRQVRGGSNVCRQCGTRIASYNAHHYQLQCKALKAALQFWCCPTCAAPALHSFSSNFPAPLALFFMFQLQAAASQVGWAFASSAH